MSDPIVKPAVKREAVLKVFPNYDRKGMNYAEIALKVKEETGILVKPGYVKHIFRGKRVKVIVDKTKAGPVLLDIKSLADRVGGLRKLRELVDSLIDMTK